MPCAPTAEFNCVVCARLLGKPYLSECCGEHFCLPCVSPSLRPQSWSSIAPCPHCRTSAFRVMLDKSFLRRLNELEVFCPLQSRGCAWKGQQRDARAHVDSDCERVELPCTYNCGVKVQRMNAERHMQEECPKRPIKCRYCSHESTQDSLAKEHENTCEKCPLACPNSCEHDPIERRLLENHLASCPLQEVDCVFKAIGCTVPILRKDLENHMQEKNVTHLMLIYALIQTTAAKEKVVEEDAKFARMELEKRDKLIASLERKATGLQLDLQKKDVQVAELQRLVDSNEQNILRMEEKMCAMEEKLSILIDKDPHERVPLQEDDLASESERANREMQTQLTRRLRSVTHGGVDGAIAASKDFGASAISKRSCSLTALVSRTPSPELSPVFSYDLSINSLKVKSNWSEPFFTDEPGYLLQLDIYCRKQTPSGCKQLCIYVYILRGKYDGSLNWPLKAIVTMNLVDRTDTIRPYCRQIAGTWNRVSWLLGKRGESHCVNFISEEEMVMYVNKGILQISVSDITDRSMIEERPFSL